jgi:serine/threonine-protein kinase
VLRDVPSSRRNLGSASAVGASDVVIASQDLLGATIDGRFTLRGLVGQGGFGAVYRADDRDGPPCALKLIPWRRAADRALAEREAARLAEHAGPGIVAFRGAGRFGTRAQSFVYIAMELGEISLEERLRQGPLSPAETRALVADLLDALDDLHARGAAHGDLKPANLVRSGGRWKVCDLGSVRAAADGPAAGSSGTPEISAPEAFDGEGGPAADLWSLGLVVHQAFARRSPFAFPSDDLAEIAVVVRTEEPRVASAVPAPFAALVRGCLVRDPARRFTTADVRRALAARDAPPPARRRFHRLPVVALICCAVAGALAIGGHAVAHGHAPTPAAIR